MLKIKKEIKLGGDRENGGTYECSIIDSVPSNCCLVEFKQERTTVQNFI